MIKIKIFMNFSNLEMWKINMELMEKCRQFTFPPKVNYNMQMLLNL